MYEDLVKALREHANKTCVTFKSVYACGSNLTRQAADAIEELSEYVDTIRRLKSDGWYLQQAKNHDGYEAIATMPLPTPPREEA